MRVIRLVCHGFMSWLDLDLDLSDLHTVAITGENGSGKSSLIEAMTFALWGEHTRDDPIYENVDQCSVQVDFESGGKVYSVIRTINRTGRDSSLTLTSAGDDADRLERKHTMAETQAKINGIIGVTYKTMIAGPLMLQDHGSPLMDLQPRERKDLLIQIFGLEIYERYYEVAAQRASDYKREADGLGAEIAALDLVIEDDHAATVALTNARYDLVVALQDRDTINSALSEAKEKQVAMREQARHAATLRDTVTALKTRIEGDQKEQGRVLRGISDAHRSLDAPQPIFEPWPEVDEAHIIEMRERVAAGRAETDERGRLSMQIPMLREKLERSEKLASIVDTVPCGGKGIYATCRFLTNAPTVEEMEKQRLDVLTAHTRLAALGTVDAGNAPEKELERVLDDQRRRESEMVRRESALAQWDIQRQAAQGVVRHGQDNLKRLDAQIERDQTQLARSLEQLSQMVAPDVDTSVVDAEVEGLKAQVDEQTRSIDMVYRPAVQEAEQAVAVIDAAKVKRGGLLKGMKESRVKAEVHAVVAKAFHRDGIPTLIIENGLPLIEERANEILERMPGSFRVRILTQRANKKGGMIDRVDIVVERGGRTRAYKNLSGGQKFRVNFALRVAIGRALSERSGTTVDMLVLDEGWGSQDKRGTEALLESLRAVQNDFKLIIVITHIEAVIDEIPTRLATMLIDEDYSTLSLVA